MKRRSRCCLLLGWLVIAIRKLVSADVVLNDKIMKLSKTAAELSVLAYEENPPNDGKYGTFGFYDEEPDQALLAEKRGYCFGAFRGTTLTWADWSQNIHWGKADVCLNGVCCSTRTGFYDAYMTTYKEEFEKAIRECAKSCANPDECVILTGHSQGGAIATVAALFLSDLNPYVITFGQPDTIDAPCELASTQRWYRYVNTKANDAVGITYDPVPFAPGLGTGSFGHMILLSNDFSGVAYVGLDAQDYFGPLNVAGFEAHSMKGTSEYPGYLDRIERIMENTFYPVRTSGYVAGSLCSQDKECETHKCSAETHLSFSRCVGTQCKHYKECDTHRCDNGICLPKLGSCQSCDENSDCAGGKCLFFRCSGSSGLMDDNCVCKWNSDCDSGRCEGWAPPQCEAQLALGAYCDESSDCLSGFCDWHFTCSHRQEEGSFCRKNDDCKSGRCSWRFRCSPATETMTKDVFSIEIEGKARNYSEPADKVSGSETVETSDYEAAGEGSSKLFRSIENTLWSLVALAIAFFGGKKFFDRRHRGYQEVPSTTLEV